VRFLIDAQLPPGLAGLFRNAGHEATHAADMGLLTASDREIARSALRSGAVVVTKDADFVALRHLIAPAPRVLWIRLGNTTNVALRRRLRPRLGEILDALESGEDLVEVR
jgi:predicted nuclease of predicted toxin-antitoxin system